MNKRPKLGKKPRIEIGSEVSESHDFRDCPYVLDAYHPSRPYKISVAVSGSVIDNAVTPQRKAYLAGQIARAISVFNIDEVIIFSDTGRFQDSQGCGLLELLFAHLECPPYLKKFVFDIMPEYQYAGLIPPLCLPHHFTKHDVVKYRDGVTTKQAGYVEVGLPTKVLCPMQLPAGVRVTVQITNYEDSLNAKAKLNGQIVPAQQAKKETGLYWGYEIRTEDSIAEVMKENQYDCIIGTSDVGIPVGQIGILNDGIPFKNILLVFGGVDGLESCTDFAHDSNETFRARFKHYVNARPSQGTKTIRTEDAIPLTLAALEPVLRATHTKVKLN